MKAITILFFTMLSLSCFPYVYHQQDQRVLIARVDVPATLEIARIELEEGGFDATLPIWAIRDQIVSEDEARAVSELYFAYIDKVAGEKDQGTASFGLWHFTWAISNLYRNGNDGVKEELASAYHDSQNRLGTLTKFKGIATEHVNGSKVYMGDIHAFARAFAHAHIVAPGNHTYLQSVDEYKKKKSRVE